MNEDMGKQEIRVAVRGSCVSYQMPWEDILEQMNRPGADRNVSDTPRPQECLKHMMQAHHQIFLLIAITRSSEELHKLREKMRAAVEKEYPDEEKHLPGRDCHDRIPPSVEKFLREHEQEKLQGGKKFWRLKKATPGDAPQPIDKCMDNLRPQTICIDRSIQGASDPASLREAGLRRIGDIHATTSNTGILPFVMPFMASRPDFFPDKRWRRMFWKTCGSTVSFGLECVSLILRTVTFQCEAEHTMNLATSLAGTANQATHTDVSGLIHAAQNLYKKLRTGFIGMVHHRIRIGGDMNKLPFATCLTALERKLAWAAKYLATIWLANKPCVRLWDTDSSGPKSTMEI
eukprot:5317010-Karenia_brevis.AAC.1